MNCRSYKIACISTLGSISTSDVEMHPRMRGSTGKSLHKPLRSAALCNLGLKEVRPHPFDNERQEGCHTKQAHSGRPREVSGQSGERVEDASVRRGRVPALTPLCSVHLQGRVPRSLQVCQPVGVCDLGLPMSSEDLDAQECDDDGQNARDGPRVPCHSATERGCHQERLRGEAEDRRLPQQIVELRPSGGQRGVNGVQGGSVLMFFSHPTNISRLSTIDSVRRGGARSRELFDSRFACQLTDHSGTSTPTQPDPARPRLRIACQGSSARLSLWDLFHKSVHLIHT